MQENRTETSPVLRRPWLVAFFLGAITLALFSPAIRFDFVNYDDNLYVYDNPAVLHGLSGAGLHYALTTGDNATWAPVTWLSYELDSSLLGTRPSSYHTTNILLHVAAGLILFFALWLMLKSTWSSALVAAIFLLHPLRTESVVWISERKDVLCALFWALGLLAYWYYTAKPSLGGWLLLLLCFLLGAMSKMMMVTFPFVLLLLDLWPLKRITLDWEGLRSRGWKLLREKIPFFVLCGLIVFLNSRALHAKGTFKTEGTGVLEKLMRVAENYTFYLGKIFWPTSRTILYPVHPVQTAAAILSLLLLVAISTAAFWQARKRPWLLVGWLWFLGALVPVIGFVSFGPFDVSDRYAYIPSIGLTLAVVVVLEQCTARREAARWPIALLLIALCSFLTYADLPRWKDSFALYDAGLRVAPDCVAYVNRGTVYLKQGDEQKAMDDFNAALQIEPDYPLALSNRGCIEIDFGNIDAAIADCSKAIQDDPILADAWNNRGNAYNRVGRTTEAVADYNQAIQLKPDKALYYNNRAAVLFGLQKVTQAKADLDKCTELGGTPHPGLVAAVNEALHAQH